MGMEDTVDIADASSESIVEVIEDGKVAVTAAAADGPSSHEHKPVTIGNITALENTTAAIPKEETSHSN